MRVSKPKSSALVNNFSWEFGCAKFCAFTHVQNMHMQNVCHVSAGFATGLCLQLCMQKCSCAKFCKFTRVRNVCLLYHCFVTNGQNTGEPICLFTYIQNCQDCSERHCFINQNQNQLQFDFKLEFQIIWLNSSFRYFICLKNKLPIPNVVDFRLQQCQNSAEF